MYGNCIPGAIHLLNGLYDAKLDKAPVLAISGQVETDLLGTDFFQEVNLERMFDDVAVYNQRIMSAEQLPAVVNQAIRMAYTKKVYPFLQFQMMSRNSK